MIQYRELDAPKLEKIRIAQFRESHGYISDLQSVLYKTKKVQKLQKTAKDGHSCLNHHSRWFSRKYSEATIKSHVCWSPQNCLQLLEANDVVSTFIIPPSLSGMSLIGRLESRSWPANNARNVVPGPLAPAIQARFQKGHDGRGSRRVPKLSCSISSTWSPSQTPFPMCATEQPPFSPVGRRARTNGLLQLLLSHIQLFATPQTVAHQAPLTTGFPRQEYWSGLPFLPPEDIPDPGIEPMSLTLRCLRYCCAPGKPDGLLTGALDSADGWEIILKPGGLEKNEHFKCWEPVPRPFLPFNPTFKPPGQILEKPSLENLTSPKDKASASLY